LSFQLWQRRDCFAYTEIKAAEAAAQYQPTAEYAALSDFEPFTNYAATVRTETLNELRRAESAKFEAPCRLLIRAAEGLLLDRLDPN